MLPQETELPECGGLLVRDLFLLDAGPRSHRAGDLKQPLYLPLGQLGLSHLPQPGIFSSFLKTPFLGPKMGCLGQS